MRRFQDINVSQTWAIDDLTDAVIAAGDALVALKETTKTRSVRSDSVSVIKGGILTELANRLNREKK